MNELRFLLGYISMHSTRDLGIKSIVSFKMNPTQYEEVGVTRRKKQSTYLCLIVHVSISPM
jgi:hypothetical protein